MKPQMTMMMCNDLMCTYKLTRSQLILAHNAKIKTDMPEKNEKQLSPWSQSSKWQFRTMEERICGKGEPGVEEKRSNGW